MTLQTMRLVIGLFGLMFWSCAWGATTMTSPVKEAAISADDKRPYWLDNTHVLFVGFTGREYGPGTEVRLLNHGYYVWDIERDTITKDARFEHVHPECINGQTMSYVLRHSTDGKTSKRQAFVNGEEVALPDRVWVNPISCHALATQPPWIVDGHTSSSKVPLLEEHGYIDRGPDGEDRRSKLPMLYYRTGTTEPISLGLESRRVEPRVTYYPFVDAYLLEGAQGTYDAPPLWLLYPNGTLEQIFSPEGKPWAKSQSSVREEKFTWASFHLTKRGLFFVEKGLPGAGELGNAGGYFLRDDTPQRVVRGVLSWGAVSPDGCKLVFSTNKWEKHIPVEDRFKLQLVDVCQGGSDVN